MGRNSQDILADKVLAETGSGPEKYAAQQRLMQDQEEYAESYVRMRALEKKYEKQQAEKERIEAGLTEGAYRFYKFMNFIAYMGMPIACFCFFIGLVCINSNGTDWIVASFVIAALSWLFEKISRSKIKGK